MFTLLKMCYKNLELGFFHFMLFVVIVHGYFALFALFFGELFGTAWWGSGIFKVIYAILWLLCACVLQQMMIGSYSSKKQYDWDHAFYMIIWRATLFLFFSIVGQGVLFAGFDVYYKIGRYEAVEIIFGVFSLTISHFFGRCFPKGRNDTPENREYFTYVCLVHMFLYMPGFLFFVLGIIGKQKDMTFRDAILYIPILFLLSNLLVTFHAVVHLFKHCLLSRNSSRVYQNPLSSQGEEGNKICSSCSAPLDPEVSTSIVTSQNCEHIFHGECIQNLEEVSTETPCPTCGTTGARVEKTTTKSFWPKPLADFLNLFG